MNVSTSSKEVFGYFVNLTTIFGILTWISILVTHISFVNARRVQGITDDEMPYTAPLGKAGSIGALVMCCLIAVFKNFDVFTPKFNAKSFVTGYLGIPLYLIMIFGHKIIKKSPAVKPENADLFSGKDRIDREEEEFLRQQEIKRQSGAVGGGQWFYKTFISWLF